MKKVIKKSNYYKQYLTYMDYFATGEGRTIEINYCFADNKEEAKIKHLDKFSVTSDSARNYFGPCIDVMPANSKKAKDIINYMFKFGNRLHKDLTKAGLEFHFKFYFNYN